MQKNQKEVSLVMMRSLLTGFFGGLLWSGMSVGMYYFNFIEISPKAYLLRTWTKASWTDGWIGDIVSILLVGLLSIVVALIYFALLKKIYSIWMGVVFGFSLWLIFYYGLHPLFPHIQSVTNLSSNTVISTLCVFILYGTFLGYSIAFDYNDTVVEKDQNIE